MRRLELTRRSRSRPGVVITGAQFRWPNCTVPYEIDAGLPNQQRVTDAIAHWEAQHARSASCCARRPTRRSIPTASSSCPAAAARRWSACAGGRQDDHARRGLHDRQHDPRDRPRGRPLARAEPRGPRRRSCTIQLAEHRGRRCSTTSTSTSPTATTSAPTTTARSCTTRATRSRANGQDTIVPTDPGAHDRPAQRR